MLKKRGENTSGPLIRTYVIKIENSITFRIKPYENQSKIG